jgi:polyketide synthase PksN
LVYFGNAEVEETIEVSITSAALAGESLLATSSCLRRQSDQCKIAVVFSLKSVESELLPRLRSILPEKRPGQGAATSTTSPAREAVEQPEYLEILCRALARVLGDEGRALQAETRVRTLGLESLKIVELGAYLVDDHQLELNAARVFEAETLRELAAFIRPCRARSDSPSSVDVPRGTPRNDDAIRIELPSDEGVDANRDQRFAIVGIGANLPGARGPAALWQVLLSSSPDVIRALPQARRELELGLNEGALASRACGYLEDIASFDHRLFKVSRREAAQMDPQQRLLLECVWEALEDAATAAPELTGPVGVFVGACHSDYAEVVAAHEAGADAFGATGTSLAALANRVSYQFGFTGPSLTVDTACSSSLVALNAAIESLRRGECASAIVGAANIICSHRRSEVYAKAGMLSSTGKCDAFGDQANGYVRGEGVVSLVLKPLRRAWLEGDRIYATIAGSAVNHGGAVSSFTVPNPKAQADVIQRAIRDSGVKIETIGMIEAHGTGTPLGDPIEINGLAAAYRALGWSNPGEHTCIVGSLKPHFGHLEGAAGLAGLIKVALALHHGTLPPSPAPSCLSPRLELLETPLRVLDAPMAWPRSSKGEPRRGAVSSFGIGGTNAHVILEQAPSGSRDFQASGDKHQLLVVSERSSGALAERCAKLARVLEAAPSSWSVASLAYTLQVGCPAQAHRLAFFAASVQDAARALAAHEESPQQSVERGAPSTAGDPQSGRTLQRRFQNAEAVEFGQLYTGQRPLKLKLPGCELQRTRHWIGHALAKRSERQPGFYEAELTLQDAGVASYRVRLNTESTIVCEHTVGRDWVLPAAAHLELVRDLGSRWLGTEVRSLRDVVWLKPLRVPASGLSVHVTLRRAQDHVEFAVQATTGDLIFSRGKLRPREVSDVAGALAPPPASVEVNGRQDPAEQGSVLSEHYERLWGLGLRLGPDYRTIAALREDRGETWAELLVRGQTPSEYVLHPQLLDGAFQTCFASMHERLTVPVGLREIEIVGPIRSSSSVSARPTPHAASPKRSGGTYDVEISGPGGELAVLVRGLSFRQFRLEDEVAQGVTLPVPEGLVPAERERLSRPIWQRTPAPKKLSVRTGATLVCVDDEDLGLLAPLRARLGRVFVVARSDRFRQIDTDTFGVDLVKPEHFASLLQQLRRQACFPERIVHLWSLVDGKNIDGADLQKRSALSVSAICQAFASSSRGETLAFVYGFRSSAVSSRPELAGVGGLCRSIHRELPQIGFRTVNVGLERAPAPELAEILSAEILSCPAGVEEVAYKSGRWVRQLQSWCLPEELSGESPFRENGTYVISGGRGGIGHHLAGWIASKYKSRIVVLGRRQEDAALRARLEEYKTAGASASLYCVCDVVDPRATRAAIQRISSELGALDGVLHCSGVLNDSLLVNKPVESMASVLGPKLRGAQNLLAAMDGTPARWLALFSSVVGALGNRGQADYAWANSSLDYFAIDHQLRRELRQERRPRVTSIAWPLWFDGGMRPHKSHARRLNRELGTSEIGSTQAFALLERFLRLDVANVVVHGGE